MINNDIHFITHSIKNGSKLVNKKTQQNPSPNQKFLVHTVYWSNISYVCIRLLDPNGLPAPFLGWRPN